MVALHLRCHLFRCTAAPDSAILQEWNYLSKRSITSLSDPSCIFRQHLSLPSNLCHKIMTLLRGKKKKKNSIITEGTIKSNSLLSLWIMNTVRFPTNSDKTSSREPFPVTQLYLGLAGQAKPWESPQVQPGSHRSSFICCCFKDVRASCDRKAPFPPRTPIKYAGSAHAEGEHWSFSVPFLATQPRSWGGGEVIASGAGRAPHPPTQKQGRSHPFFSLLWEKISTNLIDCTGLQSSVTVKRLPFPSQLSSPNSTKRGGNEKIRWPTLSHSFPEGKAP